jgi:hypothetical protein
MQVTWPSIGPGWIIALIAFVLAILFVAIGQMDFKVGALIAAVALSRLLP